MDIAPIYELKTRLRAAMIAGTNLLSEDFRLKKAAENFSALSSASPVFAKINAMTEKLLSDNSPECLLDTITLVDAVITTLGTAEVKGEIESLPDSGISSAIVNAPYSKLSAILDTLTSTDGEHLHPIIAAREESPEIFNDFRVKPALIKGLGSLCSELAGTAADILRDIGKEIIPLLKKDFDPKGKKDMIRRLHIIEELCGAEENDFYLEQLESSKNDIRSRLIFALRLDKGNVDRLIELAKTEKGKSKKAALAALITFDCEKSANFFNEYAVKKPEQVILLLKTATSEWASRLTARLINELLVDKNGNKVTLSQAADDNKVKLKSKTSVDDMISALWGKFGAEIEEIYRGFSNAYYAPFMDMKLEETILTTDDDGLKSLAMELNHAPKTKNMYIKAEAVIRLLSGNDNSKWFTKQITAAYNSNDDKDLKGSEISKTLRRIFFKDGKYYLENICYDYEHDGWIINAPREVVHPIKGEVSDALIKCPCPRYDRILEKCIDENDKEYCEKLGRYFCKRLAGFSGGNSYDVALLCNAIKKCGFKNVKDLAVNYFKSISVNSDTYWIQRIIMNIPGDDNYRLEESRAIINAARKKKYSWFNVEEFETWANANFKSLYS